MNKPLSDAQAAALAELNAGESICLGCKSLTYAKHEIVAEGLEIADFALLPNDVPAFLDRCEEIVIEWLDTHHADLEMLFEQNELKRLSARFDGHMFRDNAA